MKKFMAIKIKENICDLKQHNRKLFVLGLTQNNLRMRRNKNKIMRL